MAQTNDATAPQRAAQSAPAAREMAKNDASVPQFTTDSTPGTTAGRTVPVINRLETVRADCIQNRRTICGRILNILPDGLVIESGYTDLLREPLRKSWLVPGNVSATKPANLVEGATPASPCVGTIFLTDLPKSKKLKPQRYDYIVLEAYPAGQRTYTALGTVQHTVRNFSAVLEKAVALNLQAEAAAVPPPTR